MLRQLMLKGSLAFFLLFLLPAAAVLALNIDVDDDCSLANALQEALGGTQTAPMNDCEDVTPSEANTITLKDDVTLKSHLPAVYPRQSVGALTIVGGNFTIDGAGKYRLLTFYSGNITISNLTLTNGKSTTDGGGLNARGGVAGSTVSVTLNNVNFTNNATPSDDNGGAISVNTATFTMTGGEVSGNRTSYGGGILLGDNVTATISNVTISGNSAVESGGGLYTHSQNNLKIDKSRIINNTSGKTGGGIRHDSGNLSSTIHGNSAALGGAIFASQGMVNLNHVTLTKNISREDNALSAALLLSPFDARATGQVVNSILYGNSPRDCTGKALAKLEKSIIGLPGNCGIPYSTADPYLAPVVSPGYYPLYSDSPAIDIVTDSCPTKDQLGAARGTPCSLGAVEKVVPAPPRPRATPEGESEPQARATVKAKSSVNTCASLAPDIIVMNSEPGVQCTRVGAAGIGNATVIAAGFIDAIDVWGWLGAGVEVCFNRSSGSITFLDAATSPREVSTLPAYSAYGIVCARMDRPGILVLMAGPPPAAQITAPRKISLSNCMVQLTHMLNFRASPGGEIMSILPYNVLLTAVERSAGWFKVDYHGRPGWVSADYVRSQGSCG